jgi:hypothetical protein
LICNDALLNWKIFVFDFMEKGKLGNVTQNKTTKSR